MTKPLYPPRAKNAVHPEYLYQYENKGLFAQPKLNGSYGVLYLDNKTVELRNRHKEILSNVKISSQEFKGLYSGRGRMVVCGEYMNKNKKHTDNSMFNHKFVIFDILVYNGIHLLGKTFQQRQDILDKIYPDVSNFDSFITKIDSLDNVYRVNNFYGNFHQIYEMITPIDMYEGLVLKKRLAGLEVGLREENNTKTQFKVRKETKNYSF